VRIDYRKEIEALKRAGRFRERRVFDEGLVDLASNDYLGLAENKKQFRKAVSLVEQYRTFAPRASMLVNGYHPIHAAFEKHLAKLNGFEKGLVVGSGFLANLSLIEALVRKGDRLYMDEEYHASGIMATQMLRERTVFFRHNDADDLRRQFERHGGKRRIVAVEGVYSMSGELCAREIFELAEEEGALMIVDEAHSSGVLGKHLLGIFEHYGITVGPNHIKMGTLGKAYGSYGAYILASEEIISFLENRAKPVIYSTAPSVFDTALALVNVQKIARHSRRYRRRIEKRQVLIRSLLGIDLPALILALQYSGNEEVLRQQARLMERGIVVAAIRQPTVAQPILRIIPRTNVPVGVLRNAIKNVESAS